MEDLKKKIQQAVLAADKPPRNILAMAFWFQDILTEDELDQMLAIGEEIGETAANEWLCGLLVETGLYESDSDGYVWLKE